VVVEDARHLVQARDVVFIMLDRVERHGKRKVREAGMDAALLIDGHRVFFQVEVGDALLEAREQEDRGELVLVRKAGGCNG